MAWGLAGLRGKGRCCERICVGWRPRALRLDPGLSIVRWRDRKTPTRLELRPRRQALLAPICSVTSQCSFRCTFCGILITRLVETQGRIGVRADAGPGARGQICMPKERVSART